MASALHVTVPPTYGAERRYVLGVLLGNCLGLAHTVATDPAARHTTIRPTGDPGAPALLLSDGLFATPPHAWLSPKTVPDRALDWWPVAGRFAPEGAPSFPVCFSIPMPTSYVVPEGRDTCVGMDLLGTAFFWLSRYEEVARPVQDAHGRFPAHASLAARIGVLERPIANEAAVILRGLMLSLWPDLVVPGRTGAGLQLSHDVDWPFLTHGVPLTQTVTQAAGDLLRRRDPGLALRRLGSLGTIPFRGPEADLAYTFPLMMSAAEAVGHRSAFYFIVKNRAGRRDGRYDFQSPSLTPLLQDIHARGHEIGLHPGYLTHDRPDFVAAELALLQERLSDLGITQTTWGGRQHYLRWTPECWGAWADAGFTYDASVGFADRVGFRTGCCHEHAVFHLRRGAQLALRERPLVAMEGTLLTYMRLTPERAARRLESLSLTCRRYGGDLSLLWHNDRLIGAAERRLFLNSVSSLA